MSERQEEVIRELKLQKAKKYQEEVELSAYSEEYNGKYARFPEELRAYLAAKTEISYMAYGWIDIFKTTMIIEVRSFAYDVDVKTIESDNPLVDESIQVTCEIDLQSVRKARHELKIESFNRAVEMDRGYKMLDEIVARLKHGVRRPHNA